MNWLKSIFKDKRLDFYLPFITGVLLVVISVVYLIMDQVFIKQRITYLDRSTGIFLYGLFAGLISVAGALLKDKKYLSFISLIPAPILGCAIGNTLAMASYAWADIFTKVPFFCTNGTTAVEVSSTFIIFLIVDVIMLISLVVSIFLEKENKPRIIKA